MTIERTTPDALTIAYIAMGAKGYMDTGAFHCRTTRSHEGELDLVDAIIEHALMLDRKADARQDEMCGVFLYEVAEPFGAQVAQMHTLGLVHAGAVEALADTLIAANCI